MLCIAAACGLLCSCQKGEPKETVSLKLWGPEANQKILREMSDEFCDNYRDQAEIDVHIGVEDENDFKGDYLKNVEGSADVFSFVDDQLYELVSHDSLLPITFGTDKVVSESGGEDSPAVQSAKCVAASLRDLCELAVMRGIGRHDRAGEHLLDGDVERIAPERKLAEVDILLAVLNAAKMECGHTNHFSNCFLRIILFHARLL